MQSITLSEMMDWLSNAGGQAETLLAIETPEAMSFEMAGDLFLVAFTILSAKFGPPESPLLDGGWDWRAEFCIDASLFAVWDFDYYQISLATMRNDSEAEHDYQVVMRRHDPTSLKG